MYATAEDLAAFGGILTENTVLSREMLDKTAEAEYARGIWPEDTLDSLAYGPWMGTMCSGIPSARVTSSR